MKEVLSKARQVNMPQQAILPSRRRLIMQQLSRHAEHYVDDNQEQGAALDHPTDEDHRVQQQAAAKHHKKLMGPADSTPSSLGIATNSLAAHSTAAYNDHHHDKYIEPYLNNDHILQQEIAADYHKGTGSTRASVLHAKYGLPIQAYYNDRHDNKYPEHYSTDDHHVVQQEVAADHQQKWGSRITSLTLQEAQAQVAELRALHSAMLNNYGLSDQSSTAYNNVHQDKYTLKHPPADDLVYKSRTKKASKKKSKMHKDEDSMQHPLSSASSASSTADCFICPVQEYPIFMPSNEDNLLSNIVEGVNLMNRRSSVDNYEALMREERLNYIFDHKNKRSFSGTQFSDHFMQNNNISCLHESLNLPPRSAAALTDLHNTDDRLLHHMSLNLPQGSQHLLFNSPKQNPLFRFNDGLHTAVPSKLMKTKSDQQAAHEIKAAMPDLTGRQRALFEFLSEEPARMRAFNELASMEAPNYDVHTSAGGKVPKQKSNQFEDAAASVTSSFRSKGTYDPSRNVDHLQGSRSDHHLHQKPARDHPINTNTTQVRQKLANIDHLAQSSNGANTVSCDKCRPVAGGHAAVVPLPHSKNLGGDHVPANAAGPAAAAIDRPDQKKSFIKGWFFRGKKKHNTADHSNNQATTVSIPASNDRTRITSGAISTTKEMQSSAASTATTVATSQVFSGLVSSEAEKELEVAMAMDLMELKVLQANTKRDAAAAEVLELRLAMDSMAKKLAEVERHCVGLRTQLMDVQAMQQHDEMLVDHANSTVAAAVMIKNADPLNVNGDDQLRPNGAAGTGREESEHYESDSQELRDERRAQAKVVSMIRSGISPSYGGSSSRSCVQPTKVEFLNAVAEARVGVKQVSRVLLQHIQESKGGSLQQLLQGKEDHQKAGVEEAAGAGIRSDREGGLKKGMINSSSRLEIERWGPIMMMCKELLQKGGGMIGGSCSRDRGVGYCVEAVISTSFYEHFENVGFDKSGAHKVLDPSQRALAFYHSFLKLAKLTPTQLLTQPSPLYNHSFDRFCSRKMRSLGRAVGCPGKLWPDELARTFLSAARAVWLLHHLAFAYQNRPPGIFRVAAHSPLDSRFMEILPTDNRHVSPASHLVVSLMIMPGFFLPDDVIKCKVLATRGGASHLAHGVPMEDLVRRLEILS